MNLIEQKQIADIEELFLSSHDILPDSSNQQDPKMEYNVLADGVFWNDEGLENLELKLSNVFRYVINSTLRD